MAPGAHSGNRLGSVRHPHSECAQPTAGSQMSVVQARPSSQLIRDADARAALARRHGAGVAFAAGGVVGDEGVGAAERHEANVVGAGTAVSAVWWRAVGADAVEVAGVGARCRRCRRRTRSRAGRPRDSSRARSPGCRFRPRGRNLGPHTAARRGRDRRAGTAHGHRRRRPSRIAALHRTERFRRGTRHDRSRLPPRRSPRDTCRGRRCTCRAGPGSSPPDSRPTRPAATTPTPRSHPPPSNPRSCALSLASLDQR